MADEIPEVVRRFVAAYVKSIAQLETLLMLRGNAGEPLSAEYVARRLYCQPEMIARQLAELETAGLLEATNAEPPEYAYRPRTEELVTAVERLALIYRERRVAVTTLIYSDSTYAMRSFANAFRLWKDHES